MILNSKLMLTLALIGLTIASVESYKVAVINDFHMDLKYDPSSSTCTSTD
jgi:hypothetical protein